MALALSAKPPNILLILADDMGVECLGSYGGTSYRTPSLDLLASQGLRFRHAYATPLCAPTRTQLMTGHYAFRRWMGFGLLHPSERTFGHLLKDSGYRTAIAGKWQLWSYDPLDYPGAPQRRGIGMRPESAGFDQWSLWHTGHTEDKGSRYADPVINQNGRFRDDTRGKYGPDLWVEFLCDFMTKQEAEPFFAYYSMALPHWPMVPTPDSESWHDTDSRSREDPRHFKDMVEYADKCVGRLLRCLDEAGLSKDTVVIFYSDNGTDRRIQSQHAGKMWNGGKGSTTNAGTHVPLLVRWPGIVPPGTISDDLVDSVDFFATLADLSVPRLPQEETGDGISFYPALVGIEGGKRLYQYCHFDPRPGWDKDKYTLVRYVRDQRWKLYGDGRFFDVSVDPLEQTPIPTSALSRDTLALRKEMETRLEEFGPSAGAVPRRE